MQYFRRVDGSIEFVAHGNPLPDNVTPVYLVNGNWETSPVAEIPASVVAAPIPVEVPNIPTRKRSVPNG